MESDRKEKAAQSTSELANDNESAGTVRMHELAKILDGEELPSVPELESIALEIFSQDPIPIAPVKKMLASKALSPIERIEDSVKDFAELASILEQITLLQEIEIFKRLASGQMKESSALMLLREIRGDDSPMELSAIFNGESDGD
jgi:hypothetical protein